MRRALLAVPIIVLATGIWLARGAYSYFSSQAMYPLPGWPWTTMGTVTSSCYGGYCGLNGTGTMTSTSGGGGEVRLTIHRDPAATDSYIAAFRPKHRGLGFCSL